jgi:dynein heavy chain 2
LKIISSWAVGRIFPHELSVEGLYIQGCKFDGSIMYESSVDDPIFSKVPTFKMAWVSNDYKEDTDCAIIPVYVDPTRERLVTNLPVPCGGNASPWILAGVALFLSVE